MADFFTQLEETVASLKRILTAASTSNVAGMLFAMNVRFMSDKQQKTDDMSKLHSPARQQAFMLGLLLATEEPAEPNEFGFSEWEECVNLLNEAFGLYDRLFLPDKPGKQSEEWWRAREVAGPVFMHYFNTGLIATGSQIRARIRDYCIPFDAELTAATGISATDSLTMMTFIAETIEQDMWTMEQINPKVNGEMDRFFQSNDFLRRDNPDYPEFLREHYPVLDAYFSRFYRKGQVSISQLRAAFPEQADAFWAHYSIGRAQGSPLQYPTDKSIFDFKPLIVLDGEYASCPSANSLFEAILRACELALNNSPVKERALKYRDRVLEREGITQFRRLVGGDAQLFSSVFETPKAHKEHDLLIVLADTVLVVEAKASPPIEPSRTPERAFERLKQSFRKDTGIQKGFDQAAQIQRRLTAGEIVPLYDKAGKPVITLNPQLHKECFCICLTRDDFGHLATNLSLLLEKESMEPYPWAINIWDLESMADAWDFLKWDFDKLKEYLRQRQQAQGRVLGSDELEFVGAFIHHGKLDFGLERKLDVVQLNPNYSDFFDELHDHLKLGGPMPDHQLIKPVMMNLRESLKAGQPIFVDEHGQSQGRNQTRVSEKLGRNEPCFCGSGIKYKKCHGR